MSKSSIVTTIGRNAPKLSDADYQVITTAVDTSNLIGVDLCKVTSLAAANDVKEYSIQLPNRFGTSVRYIRLHVLEGYLVNSIYVSVPALRNLQPITPT